MSQPMPQPMVQPMYGQPVYINKVVSSKGWFNTKIVFGSLIIVTCIIILGLGGGLVSGPSAYSWYGDPVFDLILGYVPAVVSLIWQIAEFITLCVRRDRGIHPGAHVGVHLVLWMGTAACAGIITALAVYNYCGYYCQRYVSISDYQSFRGIEQALAAFVYILFILHFTLFVRACIECDRRNKQAPMIMMPSGAPQMMYVPAPQMGQNPYGVQYMQPPPNLRVPQATFAPPQTASHNSMYGFYAPQQQSAPAVEQKAQAELSTSSPQIPSAVSTISSNEPSHSTHHNQSAA